MEIVFSSTTELAAAIRAGQVSASAVLEAHLAQIERHNPALNAVVNSRQIHLLTGKLAPLKFAPNMLPKPLA